MNVTQHRADRFRGGRYKLPPVEITFTCTACRCRETVKVPWGAHHCLPRGWRSRDIVPTYALARRTDHVFACQQAECRRALDKLYPPPARPKWFTYA